MVKTIELQMCTGKTKEGKAFSYFKAVTKTGKLVRCHFRQKDEKDKPIIMPTASCIMEVEADGLDYNTSKKYPELWVRKQPKYTELAKKSKNLDELFD